MTTPRTPPTATADEGVGRSELSEVVKRIVDKAPPLTEHQRARLAILLQPVAHLVDSEEAPAARPSRPAKTRREAA